MAHTTRTMSHSLAAISLTIAVVLTEPIQANERIRTLARESLGESLKEFQAHFPRAICGSTASASTKPPNSTNAELMGKVYCYLNDKDSLARISSAPYLNLDVRAVSAIFYKNRLYNLMFDLNVRSIRSVLRSFEKVYGPPTLMAIGDSTDATKLTNVSWAEGGTKLQVRLSHLGKEADQTDSKHPGQSGAEIVCVDLWNSELGADLN